MTKWAIENLVYPMMEKKKGNRVRQKTRELEANQALPLSRLEKIQEEKLKALLIHCVDNVPAYKDFGHLKDEINQAPLEALKKIPILDKADFKKNQEAYISQKADRSSLIANETGGSSGEPVKFFMDRPTVEYYEAARWRGLGWWAISHGSPSVMLWGNPRETDMLSNKKYLFKERWLKNRIIIPAFDLDPKRIRDYIARINRFKPEYFYGYSTALETFALLMEEENLKLSFKPKAVVSTAETLHPHQREVIGKAFACPVVNEYGARDGGIIAYECEVGNMHITWDNLILEVIDPVDKQVLGQGQEGLLLVTDLNNFSMPRLRYNIGDVAAISDQKCPCGKTLPLMEKLLGREAEMFVTLEGKLIHGHAFNPLARERASIARYKIIQESPKKAQLLVVKSKDFQDQEADDFARAVSQMLKGTELELHFVDEIPLKASGKIDLGGRNFEL